MKSTSAKRRSTAPASSNPPGERALFKEAVFGAVAKGKLDFKSCSGTFTQRRKWVRAEKSLQAAHRAGEDFAVMFGDPQHDTQGIYAWAIVDRIRLGKAETEVDYRELRELRGGPYRATMLDKLTDGEKVGESVRVTYSAVSTPDFLQAEYRASKAAVLTSTRLTNWRQSPDEAAKLFERLLPDVAERTAVLRCLLESIREAHRERPDAWGISMLRGGRIRLNMGWTELFVLRKEDSYFLISGGAARKHAKVTVKASKYRWIRESWQVYGRPRALATAFEELREPHFRAVADAAQQKRSPRIEGAHSPGVLAYLRAFLNTAVPDPEFAADEPRSDTAHLVEYSEEPDDHQGASDIRLYTLDPAAVERGLRGHRRTQDQLAALLRSRGLVPQQPRGGLPDFDLGWCAGDTFHVAEVKSLTEENEVSQLRLGLGQVLEYRYAMICRREYEKVEACLVVEREPNDAAWRAVCRAVGVLLTWAPDFPGLVL